MSRLAIYTCGGFGREVAHIAREGYRNEVPSDDDIVFVDDDPRWIGKIINGLRCLSFDDLRMQPERAVSVAVADPKIRAKIVSKCEDAGLRFNSLCSVDHRRRDFTEIGEGAILCGNSVISPNTKIGRHFHFNVFGYISHDCAIGDFVTFYPGVRCSGNVVIESYASIGANAVIRQGKEGAPMMIGEGATIGMGAVVTKNVPAGAIVIGNPAKQLSS